MQEGRYLDRSVMACTVNDLINNPKNAGDMAAYTNLLTTVNQPKFLRLTDDRRHRTDLQIVLQCIERSDKKDKYRSMFLSTVLAVFF